MEKANHHPLWVSTFQGFSKPAGNVLLAGVLNELRGEKYLTVISRLRILLAQGRTQEAARVKRQLPAFTLSALYENQRTAQGLRGYNDVLMLDFDKLGPEQLQHCRTQIQAHPDTLFCFLSPSGAGLKAGVHFRSPRAQELREELLRLPVVNTDQIEVYHRRMFELCREAYEAQCSTPLDGSGSDVGRLCFVSHDPLLYINPEAIRALEQGTGLRMGQLTITPPAPLVKGGQQPTEATPAPTLPPGDVQGAPMGIDPQLQMEFQRCMSSANRSFKYEHGQRDMYIYTLGNKCYKRHIPQAVATQMAQQMFGADTDIDIPRIMANAYRYTEKTDRREKEQDKPLSIQVLDQLGSLYETRRNVVLENLEFRHRSTTAPAGPFRPILNEDFNNMYLDVVSAGINCQPRLIRTVVDSRFSYNYNPFEEYFYNLPPWDGHTDHIDRLAQTVQTNFQAFWRDCFKRWLVGVVACALDDNHENQLALIIKGAQGKGKSTWIRHLLPPELKRYYRNGMLKPGNKDHMLMLSECILINLEELEAMKSSDIAELKRLIAQDSVTERKVYREQSGFYIRRASFIASTNEPRFLEDITGTRRFPTVTAEEIDYKSAVNHAGIYAQALQLWKSGFRYWYEESEFRALNAHNAQYTIASQEQELLYHYFRLPLPTDIYIKWMPASTILTYLNIWGKLQPTKGSQRALISVLEQGLFPKRETDMGVVEYEVCCINPAAAQL